MGALDYVDADAVGGTVIDGCEDGHLAVLVGERGGGVCAPDLIGLLGDNAALMRVAGARPVAAAGRATDVYA